MDSKTPSLDAIQKIPGNTPKEKHQYLNQIIKQVIDCKKTSAGLKSQTLYGSIISEALTPIIEIETAKVLKNADHVIVALKSEDVTIVKRALRVKWFFDGSYKSVTNYPYFATHILPEVSLNMRTKIIKRLSQHLGSQKEYSLAQEFFEGFAKSFCLKDAMPLLPACSENYILEFIKDEKLTLSKKMVTALFQKYPELVIKYLKSRENKFDSYCERKTLSGLIKNHINDFIELANSNYSFVNLSKKSAELFLKSGGIEAVIENPTGFIGYNMLSLELVSRKLNKEQFELMLRKFFPEKQDHFSFDCMLTYVEFQPEELKLPLIMKVFRDLYGTDLINFLDKVTVKMMLMLPEEDRVKIAEKKLALDPELKLQNCEESWLCYLSTKDSIPRIKEQISKTAQMLDRASLVKHLLYTCKVNKSQEDLLLVLKYISSRHRNEILIFWFKVYESLMEFFDLELLSADHWEVLNEMIRRSYIKDYLIEQSDVSENLLEKVIHYKLLNNLPIEEPMTILTELKIKKGECSKFNILTRYPKYEKQCLEKFVDIIQRKFPEGHKIWKDNRLEILQNLVIGFYDYNTRVTTVGGKKRKYINSEELLSVMKYPWLLEIVNYIVHDDGKEVFVHKIDEMKATILKHERKLYHSWFPSKETKVFEPLRLLKQDPGIILKDWKSFLERCKENIKSFHTKRFLKECVWYANIPAKFAEESLKEVGEGDLKSLMILALLLNGRELSQIIEPMIPVPNRMDIDEENIKESVRAAIFIPKAINLMNPPPSLELVGRLFQDNYVALGLICLMNVARRVSVKKVNSFARELVKKPISVKKHGIRLMCSVAQTTELCEFLRHVWTTEKDKSIRKIVFQNIYKLFCSLPSEDTWLLMKFCIKGLTAEEVECVERLKELKNIPKEYSTDYFEAVLSKIEQLAKEGLNSNESYEFICTCLRNAKYESCTDFPEEYCRVLVRKFAFNFSIDKTILELGQSYAIHPFLLDAGDKLESRLKFFCDLLATAISNHWNDRYIQNLVVYPMKRFFQTIVERLVGSESSDNLEPKISKALMNLFPSVLEPAQAPRSFLYLFFVIAFKNTECDSRKFGLSIGQKMPNLIEVFSVDMLLHIAYELSDFMEELRNDFNIKSVIEGLLETNTIHSNIVATILLGKKHTKIPDDEYKDILERLKKLNHPAIVTYINLHCVSINFEDRY